MYNDTVSMLGDGSFQTIQHTIPHCYGFISDPLQRNDYNKHQLI